MRSISNDDGNTKKTPLEKRIRDMLKYFALSNIFKYFSFSNATDDSGSPKFDVVFCTGNGKEMYQNAKRTCRDVVLNSLIEPFVL